jgi:excinuclease ABC subunit C
VVPFLIPYPEKNIIITVPKGGDRKKLLELSEKNVNYFLDEIKTKKLLHLDDKSATEKKKVLFQLKQDLHLEQLPMHIECFDNSTFRGSFPVSAMVCFKNGVPSKKDYRHFNVKTVEGINNFASMKEVVFRRYKRMLAEEQPLPQLVIIDGGKGQLSAAMESIKALNLVGKITVIGLAKNEEEIFFPGDMQSSKLNWNNESIKLIRTIRDEVHRFGINFHRSKRSKGTFINELENIKGIGKNTATQLLQTFKSVKNIKEQTEEQLAQMIGKVKAKLICDYFHK